jgi:hypothetical protein
LGEQIVQTEETLHGNQEESRQEKETLGQRTLVKISPQASPEKHLWRGFSVAIMFRALGGAAAGRCDNPVIPGVGFTAVS